MTAPRVAIAGATGRMGRALVEAARASKAVTFASALDVKPGEVDGQPVGTDVAQALAGADVLIDFTRPAGTMAHVAACVAAGKRLVIGTTGFEPDQVKSIREAARHIAIVMAPNMSIGVNVALRMVELAARALPPEYDIDVFEMHHRLKVDAPSGTALKLGEVAAAARGGSLERDAVYGRHGVTGERRAGSIGFSVARGGDVVGDHTVYFAGPGERIELTHRAASRTTYAQGALRAACFLMDRSSGLFDMQDVLGLRG